MVKKIINIIDKIINKFIYIDQWNIAIIENPINRILVNKLDNDIKLVYHVKKNEFYADPFGIYRGNKSYLFYEYFDRYKDKGVINCSELQNGQLIKTYYNVLNIPRHTSYPFILEHEHEIYCLPEDLTANELSLYRAVAFPTAWEKAATILKDFQAVDPTLFFFNKYWWLFCTNGREGRQDKLCAFFAPELYGPWTPHKRNPIKQNVKYSRPAGTPFIHEGKLFRPAQDCSEQYGGSIGVNLIQELTPHDFIEQEYCIITPPSQLKQYTGIHTLSGVGDYTVIDVKKKVFSPWLVLNTKVLRYIKRKLHLVEPR